MSVYAKQQPVSPEFGFDKNGEAGARYCIVMDGR
jgi:hypothetical protein